MAIERSLDGIRNAHIVASGADGELDQGIEVKTDVTSAANATTLPADADLETGATAPAAKEDEIYSVFSKRQRILILVMTVLGAIVSPISGQI